ncbi:Vigilin [Araneus ventricosus]|uniref:Vigilin n=1 Tax=Araneus ventricosus TaxID=182803 RepID=A0A4Y2LDY3_ARAVE|nr:Vigilin [Araneus ventricosus]
MAPTFVCYLISTCSTIYSPGGQSSAPSIATWGGVPIFTPLRYETNTRIDLPAKREESDVIVICGHREYVLAAKEKILAIQEELDNFITQEITIPAKLHNAIIGTKGRLIRAITEECGGVTIKFPTGGTGSDKVSIRGPKEDVLKAKKRLLEISNEKQLVGFTAEIKANPEQHKFLIGRNGVNINKVCKKTGARIVFPNENDEDKNTITIIGRKEEVEAAKAELNSIIEQLQNTAELTMDIHPKHHCYFVAKDAEVLEKISNDYVGVSASFPRKGSNSSKVVLKGAKDFLEGAKQRLLEIVEYLEAVVTFECVIPQEHHRTVLGARGSKVRNIQRQYNVTIKFPDRERAEDSEKVTMNGDGHSDRPEGETNQRDIITIKGRQENCEAAAKALKDSVPVTEEMEVPNDLRRFIIGQKGKDVRSMMETYDVHIIIPPQNEQSDVTTITGPPENVAKAKEALKERIEQLELEKQDRLLRRFQLTVEVDPQYHPKIIGRNGEVISKIRKDHYVQIHFPERDSANNRVITITGYEDDDEAAKEAILKLVREQEAIYKEEVSIDSRVHSRIIGNRGRSVVKIMDMFTVDIRFPRSSDPDPDLVVIQGAKDDVLDAKDHLLNLAKEYQNIAKLTMDIDRKYRRYFAARGAEVLKQISKDYGGVTVNFLRKGSNRSKVVLKGAKNFLEGTKQHLQEIVEDLEAVVTFECVIPQEYHRTVLGTRGSKVQNIQREYNVTIKFPDRESAEDSNKVAINGDAHSDGPEGEANQRDIIIIKGRQENCESAAKALKDRVPVTEEMEVPYDLHRFIIGQKGKDIRSMMETYDANIIFPPQNEQSDVITITGPPENVAKAKEALKERIEQLELEKQDRILKSFQLTVEVDPQYYPKIIGRYGAFISKIRKDHNVQINFPKRDSANDRVITITGYEKDTEAAKEAILKLVQEQEDMYKEEVSIDSRVHSRIIGSRGRNVVKIMDMFKVDIHFLRSSDPDPDLVVIQGAEDDVLDAKDHLLNLENEYLRILNLNKCFDIFH